jgi:hypothetical protein
MNIYSSKRLKVASRHSPPFSPWAKEAEAYPRSFGEGNSFEEGSEQRGCSLLEEMSGLPPIVRLSDKGVEEHSSPEDEHMVK